MTDYEWIDRGRRREQIVVAALNKPRMPAEARDILGYKRSNKLTVSFKELRGRGIIRQKAKGLYGLTERGQRLRKTLLHERGLQYSYSEPRLDWQTYTWVIVGKQRKVLLRVLERHPRIAAELLRMARKLHGVLSRTDTYKVLHAFVGKKLAEGERDERHVHYAITRKGEAIKDQMLFSWMSLFLFL